MQCHCLLCDQGLLHLQSLQRFVKSLRHRVHLILQICVGRCIAGHFRRDLLHIKYINLLTVRLLQCLIQRSRRQRFHGKCGGVCYGCFIAINHIQLYFLHINLCAKLQHLIIRLNRSILMGGIHIHAGQVLYVFIGRKMLLVF